MIYNLFFSDLILTIFSRSNLISLLTLIWVFFILGSLLVNYIPYINCVSCHGKLYNKNSIYNKVYDETSSRSCFNNFLVMKFNNLYISKEKFSHFYYIGFFFTLVLIFINKIQNINNISLILFLLHNLRRIFETFFITSYENINYLILMKKKEKMSNVSKDNLSSKMHIGGYLCGLTHYTLTPLTLHLANFGYNYENIFFYQIFVILLFILFNYVQYSSHFILFKNKNELIDKYFQNNISEDTKIVYTLPTKGAFKFCSCPHYFSEIMIYLSLFLLNYKSFCIFFLFLWVLSNLTVVSYNHYTYYLNNNNINLSYILFPFIW